MKKLLIGLLAAGSLLAFGAPAYADYYEIRNFGSEMCAGLNSWELYSNGAPIVQHTCNGSPEQLWSAVPVGSDYYMFVNLRSGKCMDVTNGTDANWTPVQQWACTNTNGMKWKTPVPAFTPHWVTTRLGARPPYVQGRCLDVRGGSLEEGAQIQIYNCTSNNSAQVWTITQPRGA
jgi:hypothetical protein